MDSEGCLFNFINFVLLIEFKKKVYVSFKVVVNLCGFKSL